jgi:hypothetical protein
MRRQFRSRQLATMRGLMLVDARASAAKAPITLPAIGTVNITGWTTHAMATSLSALDAPAAALGVPPLCLAMALAGACARLVSLPLSLLARRAMDRHVAAGPAVHRAAKRYWEVASHPHAVREEVELAFTKLHERRGRILARYDTSMQAPALLRASSMITSGGLIGLAAYGALGVAATNPAAAAWVAWPLGLNPLIPVTAALFYKTQLWDMHKRRGMGDYSDAVLAEFDHVGLQRVLPAVTVTAILVSAALAPVSAGGVLLPLAAESSKLQTFATLVAVASPAALSAAAVGGAGQYLADQCVPLKRALRWPLSPPPEHGTYGPVSYSFSAHMRLVRQLIHETEGHMHADSYRNAKHNLECECDLRIQKMPIAKKFFRDTRFDRAPEEAPSPYKKMTAFEE